jgi:23S rRNA (guanosine2251-2'-O)-methyltransferase
MTKRRKGAARPAPSTTRVVFGVRPVEELLRREDRRVEQLLVARDARLGPLIAAAERRGIPVVRTAPGELSALCGESHQGVAALAGAYPYRDLEHLLDLGGVPLLLLVDGVTDPQNLGAMIRSAVVLGATGLVLTKDRCAGITPAVVRVSSGATEHLPCARITNLVRAIEQLKAAGVWVAATVERGGGHPADTDLTVPLALVMGSEQRGVRPLVLRHCDMTLTIPSRAQIASLNVAAATTAVLYEANRQRREGSAQETE